MIQKLSIIALIGGIAGLDTTAAWQILLSQPLISCGILGWLLDRPDIGLLVGLMTQLLWLTDVPIGGAWFPEGNLGSLVATALAIEFLQTDSFPGFWIMVLAISYGTLIAYVGGTSVVYMRRRNSHLIHWANQLVDSGSLNKISWLHRLGVLHAFVNGALVTSLAFLAGLPIVGFLLRRLVSVEFDSVSILQFSLLATGAGLMSLFFWRRDLRPFIFIGMLGGIFSAFFL